MKGFIQGAPGLSVSLFLAFVPQDLGEITPLVSNDSAVVLYLQALLCVTGGIKVSRFKNTNNSAEEFSKG